MCSPWKSNPLFMEGPRVPPTFALLMFKREVLAPAPSRYGLFCLGGLRELREPLGYVFKGGGLLFPISNGGLARLGELLFPISCGVLRKFMEGF